MSGRGGVCSRSERETERESERETERWHSKQLPGLIGVISRLTLQAAELWQHASSVQICGAFSSKANLSEMLQLKTDDISIKEEGLKLKSGIRESCTLEILKNTAR